MDCPLMRFKNGFVDLTVQKLQRERPLEVWSTSSSELQTFFAVVDISGNCGDHMTGDRAESKSVNTVANLALRRPTEENGESHPGAGPFYFIYLFILLKQLCAHCA